MPSGSLVTPHGRSLLESGMVIGFVRGIVHETLATWFTEEMREGRGFDFGSGGSTEVSRNGPIAASSVRIMERTFLFFISEVQPAFTRQDANGGTWRHRPCHCRTFLFKRTAAVLARDYHAKGVKPTHRNDSNRGVGAADLRFTGLCSA